MLNALARYSQLKSNLAPDVDFGFFVVKYSPIYYLSTVKRIYVFKNYKYFIFNYLKGTPFDKLRQIITEN